MHSGIEGTVCPCVVPNSIRINPMPTVPGLVWHIQQSGDSTQWRWDDFYKTTSTKPLFVGTPTSVTYDINGFQLTNEV